MEIVCPPRDGTVVLDSEAARERQRDRRYVLCQVFGWGAFLLVQLAFLIAFGEGPEPRYVAVSSMVMVTAAGLLITHYTRPLLHRWNWKMLGWRALLPRLFLAALTQSLLWTGFCRGYGHLLNALLGVPWTSKYSPVVMLALGVVNGTFLLAGWLGVYFFYHLSDRYNRLQIAQLQLVAHAKEAELRALKSQVNPHFIFNALNSLRALIDENPARAREAVTQLANLLRYSLQSAQSETVAFESELRVVNDYLALEQVRHEERLRVRLDVAPETLGLAVPPLLLQTLVENAVKYGISNRPEGGEIVISAQCVAGHLELRVTNPGELAPSAGGGGGGPISTGLGLKNAGERLRMFFGDRARLQLRTEAGERVVAEVSIPLAASRA